MALTFITITDTSGRNSSLALNGNPHYNTPGYIKVVGNLNHGADIRPAREYDRVALIKWLNSIEVIEACGSSEGSFD